ncbi:MAG TPA: aldehyde dehydrogenase family protein [Steroidobacteraceae bacterium]
MTIDGRLAATTAEFPIINPATGAVLAHAPNCSLEQLNSAVECAARAFTSWRDRPVEERRQLLRQCAARIRANQAELARMLTQEQGKPTVTANREVGGSAKWLEHTADLDIPRQLIALDAQRNAEVTRKPYGVVAGIVPWNYPLMSACWKIGPAVLAGNTIVIKPSPFTPLTTLRLGELLLDILPPGVLNIISGTDELAPRLSSHPGVRKVSFTGSTATGRKVFSAAAADIKGLTLELGGNDPALVLQDVDPIKAAARIYAAAFENAGQVCAAIKRVYVQRPVHDALVNELARLAQNAVVGDGLDPQVTIGPVSTRPQFERVLQLMQDAHQCGGRFVAGKPEAMKGPGYFIRPAIVTGLDHEARLVMEEQFGPVLPVLPFDEIDQAIAAANATPYGLSASVWSDNAAVARAIAPQIDAGTVWLNQHLSVLPSLPTAGVKQSGLGAENGPWGLENYLQIQTIAAAG